MICNPNILRDWLLYTVLKLTYAARYCDKAGFNFKAFQFCFVDFA